MLALIKATHSCLLGINCAYLNSDFMLMCRSVLSLPPDTAIACAKDARQAAKCCCSCCCPRQLPDKDLAQQQQQFKLRAYYVWLTPTWPHCQPFLHATSIPTASLHPALSERVARALHFCGLAASSRTASTRTRTRSTSIITSP